MNVKSYAEIERLCHQFRIDLIEILHHVQTGHPGSSLSACEILATLYFRHMRVNPADPTWDGRDRMVLSKGHASPMLYLVLAELGFFPKEELWNLRGLGQMLQGHPSPAKIPGTDVSTGPLGLGLSAACGLAAGAKLQQKDYFVYAIVGDGELQEGIVWEALMSASKFSLDNLIVIVDCNKVQLDGTTQEVMPMGNISDKLSAFGMYVQECDGHNPKDFSRAVENAQRQKGSPSAIIAHTIKGKGVSFMEGESKWHGAVIDDTSYALALKELRGDTLWQ